MCYDKQDPLKREKGLGQVTLPGYVELFKVCSAYKYYVDLYLIYFYVDTSFLLCEV